MFWNKFHVIKNSSLTPLLKSTFTGHKSNKKLSFRSRDFILSLELAPKSIPAW